MESIIKRIKELEKGEITADTFGKIAVLEFICEMENKERPKNEQVEIPERTFEPLELTQEELARVRDYDIIAGVYKQGRKIYPTLVQQFCNGIGQYQRYLADIGEGLKMASFLDNTAPLFISAQEHEKLKARAIKENKAQKSSYLDIVGTILYNATAEIEKAPKPIKEALEALKKEPAPDGKEKEYFLSWSDKCFYTVEDCGICSKDFENLKEFEKAIKRHYLKNHAKGYMEFIKGDVERVDFNIKKLYFLGVPAIIEEAKKITGKTLTDEQAKTLYNDLKKIKLASLIVGDEKNARRQNEITINDILEWKAPHVTRTTMPGQSVSKFDLISLFNVYIVNDEKNAAKIYEQFRSECPELFKALRKYIDEFLPASSKLPTAQHLEPLYTWAELEKLDFMGVETYQCDDISSCEIIEQYNKEHHTAKGWECEVIIANVEDAEPVNNQFYKIIEESKEVTVDYIETDRAIQENIDFAVNEAALPAIQYAYAYNALLDILASAYDLPELRRAQLYTERFEEIAELYNKQLFEIYYNLSGTPESIEETGKVIKRFFKPIIFEDLKPSKEKMEIARKEISSDELLSKGTYGYYLKFLKRGLTYDFKKE